MWPDVLTSSRKTWDSKSKMFFFLPPYLPMWSKPTQLQSVCFKEKPMFLVGTHLEFIFLTLLENSFQVNSFFSHFFIFRQTCSCLYLLCVSNSHLAVKKIQDRLLQSSWLSMKLHWQLSPLMCTEMKIDILNSITLLHCKTRSTTCIFNMQIWLPECLYNLKPIAKMNIQFPRWNPITFTYLKNGMLRKYSL